MAWTPESGFALDPVDAGHVEEQSIKTWYQYLTGYFDGLYHGDIYYPSAGVYCQQSRILKPMEGLSIQIISNLEGTSMVRWANDGREAMNKAQWTFYIRASVQAPRTDGQNAESLCRQGADRLYALLMDSLLVRPLNRAGILTIRPLPARIAPEVNECPARKVLVRATLHFAVPATS